MTQFEITIKTTSILELKGYTPKTWIRDTDNGQTLYRIYLKGTNYHVRIYQNSFGLFDGGYRVEEETDLMVDVDRSFQEARETLYEETESPKDDEVTILTNGLVSPEMPQSTNDVDASKIFTLRDPPQKSGLFNSREEQDAYYERENKRIYAVPIAGEKTKTKIKAKMSQEDKEKIRRMLGS